MRFGQRGLRVLTVTFAGIMVVSCGGGGTRGAAPGVAVPAAGAPASVANVAIHITVPSSTSTAAVARRTQYLSPFSQSIAIAVNGGVPTVVNLNTSSPNCAQSAPLVCTATVVAPVGPSVTFVVALYDNSNATGNLLSRATLAQAIVANGNNVVNITTSGVVASVTVAESPPSVTVGQSSTVTVSVGAYDADSNLILASGGYVDANGDPLTFTLSNTDTSGTTTLSQTTVTGPTSGITLAYNGAFVPAPTLGASVSGGTVPNGIQGSLLSVVGPGTTGYVADRDNGSILTFSITGPFGNVAPSTTIAGNNTGLIAPDSLGVDGTGEIYTNADDNAAFSTFAVFASGANGNVTPVRTFTPTPNQRSEVSVLIDASGNEYSGDWQSGLLDVYAAGASGSVAPTRTISGGNTGLGEPLGLWLTGGNLYVADRTANAVYEFPQLGSGNIPPTTAIVGGATGINHPTSVALDANGRIIVTNEGAVCCSSGYVLIFAAGASGNIAPVATISGANTGLQAPSGVSVDGAGNIWVADGFGGAPTYHGALFRFAPTANGNVAPTATIEGAATTLNDPQGFVIY